MLNRREFLLKTLQSTAVSSALLGSPVMGLTGFLKNSQAQQNIKSLETNLDHFLVVLEVPLSMDAVWGLDPYVPAPHFGDRDLHIGYRPSAILRHKNISLGPAASQALRPHLSSCAIINGLCMRNDGGHDLTDVTSGSRLGQRHVAYHLNQVFETPLGAMLGSNINTSPPSSMLSTPTSSIYNMGNGSGDQNDKDNTPILVDSQVRTPLQRTLGSMQKAQILKPKMEEKLNEVRRISNLNDANAMAVAFLVGAAKVGVIGLRVTEGALDSHSDHDQDHPRAQRQIWEQVAQIFSLFKRIPFSDKGESLFDRTTFFVATEFSRTPYLNSSNGKDHNPYTNSILLAGRGVNGGQVYGKSQVISRQDSQDGQAYHIANPYLFKEGRVAELEKGEQGESLLYPEHVIQTIYQVMGISPVSSPLGPGVQVIPKIIKS